jgi:hypothetical protein
MYSLKRSKASTIISMPIEQMYQTLSLGRRIKFFHKVPHQRFPILLPPHR